MLVALEMCRGHGLRNDLRPKIALNAGRPVVIRLGEGILQAVILELQQHVSRPLTKRVRRMIRREVREGGAGVVSGRG